MIDPEEKDYNDLPKSQINGKRKNAAAQPPGAHTQHLWVRNKQNRVFSPQTQTYDNGVCTKHPNHNIALLAGSSSSHVEQKSHGQISRQHSA